jgi:hypothetical protein
MTPPSGSSMAPQRAQPVRAQVASFLANCVVVITDRLQTAISPAGPEARVADDYVWPGLYNPELNAATRRRVLANTSSPEMVALLSGPIS